MKALSAHLGTDLTDLDDETLILLRLLGRPFGRPMNSDLGEEPEDVILAYLKDNKSPPERATAVSAPFISLLDKLLAPPPLHPRKQPKPIESLLSGLPDDERAALAFSVVRLLDDSQIAIADSLLKKLARRFNPGPCLKGPALSVFWHLLVSRFSSDAIRDDEIAVCRKTILEPTFIEGPLVAAAKARPYLFFGTIVPIIFEALREKAPQVAQSLYSLRPAMKAGFAALYREGRSENRRRSYLQLLASQLEVLTAAGPFTSVAGAVLEGAASATNGFHARGGYMPFEDFALLESGYSRGRAHAESLKPTAKSKLDRLLDKYAEPIREAIKVYMAGSVDPVLATNLNPYSEGVYFLIWQDLLDRAGFKIELEQHDWASVVPNLYSGKLSFAIWNDYVPDQYAKDETPIFRSVHPLFKYRGYPFVVRRDVLERLAAKQLPKLDAGLLVRALTRRRPISAADFLHCVGLKDELRNLRLALVGNSEIQEVADTTLGNLEDSLPMTSDKAVGELIDGKLDGAFFGGIQAAYLTEHFGHSTVTLTTTERPTPVHIWFMGETYEPRQYPKTVQPLLCAWRMTRAIWKEASESTHKGPSRDQERLHDWIMSLASRLNFGVGGDERGMRTPISSWKMLSKLSQDHNVLLQPKEVRLHKGLTPAEIEADPAQGEMIETPIKDAFGPPRLQIVK